METVLPITRNMMRLIRCKKVKVKMVDKVIGTTNMVQVKIEFPTYNDLCVALIRCGMQMNGAKVITIKPKEIKIA